MTNETLLLSISKVKNFVFKEYSREYSSGMSGDSPSSGEEETSTNSELDFTREDPAPRNMIPRRIRVENASSKV
jgi:hypothetical protein